MKIIHNATMTHEFATIMLTDFYDESVTRRIGWHRSDAIVCPLKAYWRMTGQLKPEYGMSDVGILIIGQLAHIALHKYFDAQEKVYDIHSIQITIDAIHGEYPIETKTTRKKVYRKEDIPNEWIEQLAIAMAVMNVSKGYLMVLSIITFALTVWEVTFQSDSEKEMFRNSCIWQVVSIANSVEKGDPSILAPKYEECHFCPYRPTRARRDGCIYYKKPSK